MEDNFVLALDLDRVLIDTDKYTRCIAEACEAMGITRTEFDYKYKLAKKHGYYDREEFIKSLVRADLGLTEEDIRKAFDRVLDRHAAALVYEDVLPLLKVVKAEYPRLRLVVVTRGTEFQIKKVTASGLKPYFETVEHVSIQSKGTKIVDLLSGTDGVIFVDDQLNELEETIKFFADSAMAQKKLQLVWLNRKGRGVGDLSEGVAEIIPSSVLSIASLNDLRGMLPQLLKSFAARNNTKMNFRKMNIVNIGGGTGLPALLEGERTMSWWETITALVTMSDRGGRSGKLRDRFGTAAPSDLLRCLLGLSPNQREIREYFFTNDSTGYTMGHIFMTGGEKTVGIESIIQSLREQWKVAENHYVLPVTLDPCDLGASYKGSPGVNYAYNEVEVDQFIKDGYELDKLYLSPSETVCNPKVIEAIQRADILCLGPGSFYTSVLVNLLPIGVKEAIKNSKAPIIFIANLFTEGAGMHFSFTEMIKVAEEYLGRKIDRIIWNDCAPEAGRLEKYKLENKRLLVPEAYEISSNYVSANFLEFLEPNGEVRHNPGRLAAVVWHVANDLLNGI